MGKIGWAVCGFFVVALLVGGGVEAKQHREFAEIIYSGRVAIEQGLQSKDANARRRTARAPFQIPEVHLDPAPPLDFPAGPDSNSPSFWDERGFHVFTSNQNPSISSGTSLENMGQPVRAQFLDGQPLMRWIEGVYRDRAGTVWGLYHREEEYRGDCDGRPYFTIPSVGIAVSHDGGFHWRDLGLVIRDFGIDDSCESTPNRFFAGGVGDPSWAVDESSGFAYIFYSSYSGPLEQQGIQMARISLQELAQPVGNVWRWSSGGWTEPGLGGIGKPVLEANVSWHVDGSDAFWGPSVHWNTYLGAHVVLLNRTSHHDFEQEGAYISFVPDLANPASWTRPQKIVEGGHWYVQVVGDAAMRGTDSLAGQVSRLFIGGRSNWFLRFERR